MLPTETNVASRPFSNAALSIVSVVYRYSLYFAAFRSVINKAAFRHEVYEATYTRARTSSTHVLAIAAKIRIAYF